MNENRVIAIGDIHGCYNTMVKLLKDERLNIDFQKDTVVFLGDYIDRGNFPLKTLLALKDLKAKHPNNVICLKGNHEDMCCKYYFEGNQTWSWNGFERSHEQIESYENKEELLCWIEDLPLRYETEHYCFCHSGNWSTDLIPRYNVSLCLWDRDWLRYNEYNNCDSGKPVIFGHTPHKSPTYYDKNLCIDTGVCYPDRGGSLSAVILKPDGFVKSVSVDTDAKDISL